MTLDKPTAKGRKKSYNCETCGLSQYKYINSGNLDAEVLFIRDFPSNTEIKYNNYFSTQENKYLKQAIHKAGIDISKCYFTYSLLCNLPKVPKNLPIDSVKSCGYNLLELIDKFKNLKLIIPCGDYGFKFFLNKSQLKKYRGELFKKDNLNIYPIYDPQYVLTNKQEEPTFINDLVKANKILNNEISAGKNIEFLLCNTIEDLVYVKDSLDKAEYYTFDIETIGGEHGLDMFSSENKIMTIGFTTDKLENFCIPIDHPESRLSEHRSIVIDYIRNILSNTSKRIAHNGKFDSKCIVKLLGVPLPNIYADTLLASSLLNQGNGNSNSLKRLSVELLGYAENYSVMKNDVPNYRLPLYELAKYNCEDTYNTMLIYSILIEKLKQEELYDLFFSVVMKGNEALTDIELNGSKIDIEYGKKLLEKYEENKKVLLEKLLSYNEVKEIDDFNINSPDHLGKLLYDEFKLECPKKTESGKRSVDVDSLTVLKDKHSFVSDLLLYKKYEKCIGTYITPLMSNHLKSDGKIHCNYHQDITATGRLSSSDPNLQNIPSRGNLGKDIKKLFIPSHPEWYLLQADYSQIELRVAGICAEEPTILQAYREDKDIHKITPSRMFNIPEDKVTKEERQMAKSINFGLIYGMSAKGLVAYANKNYGVTMSNSEADTARNKYFRLYNRLPKWYEEVWKVVRKTGYVTNLFGRKRKIDDINSSNGYLKGSAERKSVNTPVQSTASDMLVLSLYHINKFLKSKNMESRIINTVHDSIVLECPPNELMKTAKIVKTIMENIPTPFEKLCPIKAELEYGKNWGELEGLKL